MEELGRVLLAWPRLKRAEHAARYAESPESVINLIAIGEQSGNALSFRERALSNAALLIQGKELKLDEMGLASPKAARA